ncbi:MAG: dihydroorotate dehydrogenase [Nanoarchaeota archaeon]|nr:dihydroorotate dehydrogenase [Nanoarchaeota archaeon]
MASLKTNLCGVEFRSPLVLASGVLGVTASSMINVINNGAGGVTMKSLGPEERKGHPCPTMLSFEGGFMNAVGLSNAGIDEGVNEIIEYRQRCKEPIIASIFAFKTGLFGELAQKISKVKPDLIEINISCPNVESEAGIPFAMDKEAAAQLTKLVKQKTDIPVIVKLSPNALNIGEIAKACEIAGADAINMGNTLGPGLIINPEAKKPVLSNKFGGVSGPGLFPIALKRIWDVYAAVRIPIIGTGGVTDGRDAIQMIMAGASLVGVGTAVLYGDISVFRKMNEEILEFMEKNNYKTIKDMVGVAHE